MTDEQANDAKMYEQSVIEILEERIKRALCSDGQRHAVPINRDGWACCIVHGSDCVNRDCHNCQLANEINETRAKKLFAAGQTFTVPPIKAYPVSVLKKFNSRHHRLDDTLYTDDEQRDIVAGKRMVVIEELITDTQYRLDRIIDAMGTLLTRVRELR